MHKTNTHELKLTNLILPKPKLRQNTLLPPRSSQGFLHSRRPTNKDPRISISRNNTSQKLLSKTTFPNLPIPTLSLFSWMTNSIKIIKPIGEPGLETLEFLPKKQILFRIDTEHKPDLRLVLWVIEDALN